MEHFHQFFPAICAGLGLFLAGAANLLLTRAGAVLRVLATLGAFGLAAAASTLFEMDGALPATARLLAIGGLPIVLLGSSRLRHGIVAGFTAMGRPSVRYGLLTVGGIGLSLASFVVFERADEKMLDENAAWLEFVYSDGPATPTTRETAYTDRGKPILLQVPVNPRTPEHMRELEEFLFSTSPFRGQIIRESVAVDDSNCHGWAFTGGRYMLHGRDVELILKENGYEVQSLPRPGDLVIYRAVTGAIMHTAIVRYVAEGEPVMARSKWGKLGVYTHPVERTPYGEDIAFYRSSRSGHLLTTSPGPAQEQTARSNVE